MFDPAEDWLAQWQPPRIGVSRYGHAVEVPAKPRPARAGRSLLELAPHIAAEWDHEANGDISPSTIGATSMFPAHWQCATNSEHRWQQPIAQRVKTQSGARCAHCTIEQRLAARADTTQGRLSEVMPTDATLRFSDRNPVAEADASGHLWHDWIWDCINGHGVFIRSLAEASHGCPTCRTVAFHQQRLTRNQARIPDGVPVGGVFRLDQPRARSNEELRLAAELAEVVPVDFDHDAIRTRTALYDQPFVTPDILIPALRVAVEWDGGRHRHNPDHDAAKDAAAQDAGWRIVRVGGAALTLAVVADVLDRIIDPDDEKRRFALEQWRASGRWVGTARYEALLGIKS